MGSRRPAGYEYRHRFWVDDSVIPMYDSRLRMFQASVDSKRYLFEIQTNFKLMKRVDNTVEEEHQVMGSESFAAIVPRIDGSWWLENATSGRLNDYCMSIDEIKSLVDEALDFAKQKIAVDAAKYASYYAIPVVVGLDVCTVQQEGESIDMAMDRAIRPEGLFPLNLCFVPRRTYDYRSEKPYILHQSFLMGLRRVGQDDDLGLARMEGCAVCSRDVPAAKVSYLPCSHVFHSHCVFRWFNDGKSSCPSCGVRVPADLEEECSDDDIFLR